MTNNYEELVKRLRDDNACLSIKTAHEAADAIEELQAAKCPHYIRNVHDRGDDSLCDKFVCEVKSLPKWIPVTERLPEDAGIYIICDHYGNVMSRHFCKSHGKFAGYWHFNGSAKYGNPTHWMPLPEPPRVDPCADCVHYPPSSTDGKPCCACDPENPLTNCHEAKGETE